MSELPGQFQRVRPDGCGTEYVSAEQLAPSEAVKPAAMLAAHELMRQYDIKCFDVGDGEWRPLPSALAAIIQREMVASADELTALRTKFSQSQEANRRLQDTIENANRAKEQIKRADLSNWDRCLHCNEFLEVLQVVPWRRGQQHIEALTVCGKCKSGHVLYLEPTMVSKNQDAAYLIQAITSANPLGAGLLRYHVPLFVSIPEKTPEIANEPSLLRKLWMRLWGAA